MISLLARFLLLATVCLQVSPSSSNRAHDFDRLVKATGERWNLQRAIGLGAPGLRNETEIYEWRDSGDGNKRIFISIHHYTDAAEAREHVEHLFLAIATLPVDGIGDAAKIASMKPGDPSSPGTVHFSVEWMYVQVSAPTAGLAMKLAPDIAEELRSRKAPADDDQQPTESPSVVAAVLLPMLLIGEGATRVWLPGHRTGNLRHYRATPPRR
jgi:hypothetical protein